ncbi:MAG TPA: hypothetical protein PLV68_00115 [Ilumatobacteraceae bacterium]|nr:hypothetical protein [Ilumatobacteraceae bacterium]
MPPRASRSSAEVVEAVQSVLASIAARTDEAETLRRVPGESIKELVDTDVMRLLQPKRWGGLEGDPRDFYKAVLAVAAVCGSTGWVTGVVGIHNWQLGLFDDRLQAEIWGENPDELTSSSYMPGGSLTPVTGGYEVTGRWNFSSGSDHCGWAILGALHHRSDAPPAAYQIVVPRTDYVVEDTWHTVGLRGTGSNDIVIEKAFVPSHRILTRDQIYNGDAPGLEVNDGPLFRMPFPSVFPNVITGPIIGMAEGMLALDIEHVRTRVSRSFGKAVDGDPYSVAAIGEAAREIDACRLQLLTNIGEMYEILLAGGTVPMALRTRTRRDQVIATERCVAAIDNMFDRGGAGVLATSHPMQRIWRDAHAAKHHMVNTNERTLYSWAHHAMGLGTTDPVV